MGLSSYIDLQEPAVLLCCQVINQRHLSFRLQLQRARLTFLVVS